MTQQKAVKICRKCNITKEFSEFKVQNGYLLNTCKKCVYADNSEKRRQKKKTVIKSDICYIYTLTMNHKPDIVWYVGKCTDPYDRLKCHLWKARNKQDNHLHKWMKEQLDLGYDFTLNIIDDCNSKDWAEKEHRYIKLFLSAGAPLQNRTKGGKQNSYKAKPRPHQYKPVAMLDKETKQVIMEFPAIKFAAQYLNKPKSAIKNIGMCARGESPSMYGYKWRYL